MQLRQQLGLTRQAVADRSGGEISQQYVHRIETGLAENIGSEKLTALARGLDVPVAVLQQALFQKQAPVIPVLGRVSGGGAVPRSADEYAQEQLRYAVAHPPLFAVEMIGDSMAPKIEHGDWIIAEPIGEGEPMPLIMDGAIYVLEKQQRLTCKYLLNRIGSGYWLEAEQPTIFAPEPLSNGYKILGRVVEVRKTQTLIRPVNGFTPPSQT